jgi:hypothetical protein
VLSDCAVVCPYPTILPLRLRLCRRSSFSTWRNANAIVTQAAFYRSIHLYLFLLRVRIHANSHLTHGAEISSILQEGQFVAMADPRSILLLHRQRLILVNATALAY